jgi:hypothetical protein
MERPAAMMLFIVIQLALLAQPVRADSYVTQLLHSMKSLVEQTYLEPYDSPNQAGAVSTQILNVLTTISGRSDVAAEDVVLVLDVLDELANVNGGETITNVNVIQVSGLQV